MKVPCGSCGVHFPDEFQQTLKEGCTFWSGRNLETLPDKDKERFWDWSFAFDFDELYNRTGTLIKISYSQLQGHFPWEKVNPDYPDYSEEEKRAFQKAFTLKIREYSNKKTLAYWKRWFLGLWILLMRKIRVSSSIGRAPDS